MLESAPNGGGDLSFSAGTGSLPISVTEEPVAAEDDTHKSDSNPTALIGMFCLKYALSRNAMAALLELLRLNLDVSCIQNVDQILCSITSAPARLQSVCRNCHTDQEIDDCTEDWLENVYCHTLCVLLSCLGFQ